MFEIRPLRVPESRFRGSVRHFMHLADTRPLYITRNGAPATVLLSTTAYNSLLIQERRRNRRRL